METYHVLSRGIEKRKIFLDKKDYLRFVHDLYEFNDENPVENSTIIFSRQCKDIQHPYIGRKTERRNERKLLVHLLIFTLMPNHYHLLIMAEHREALTLFMRKLNGGYARYFNERYKRKGPLFESRFKSILVKDEAHFIHLPYYIHCNSLDLIMPEWRRRELRNYKKALKFLEDYRWSSHADYIGKKNFPSVTQRDFLLKYFGDIEGYKKEITSWLKSPTGLNMEITLEN